MSHFHVAWSPRLSARCAAGTLSLLAHVTVLGILLSPPAPRDWPSSIGRKVGSALMVRLEEHTEPVNPLPASQPNLQTRSPAPSLSSTDADITPATEASPTTEPTSQLRPTDTQPAPIDQLAQQQAATPPASAPGASFANLFAPIISRPMGRGRWGSPPPIIAPPQDHDLIRQQALQARRDQLTQTLRWLETQLIQTPLNSTCQVQVALSQAAGTATCIDTIDQNRIAQVLTGFLASEQAEASPPDICLTLANNRIEWLPCQQASSILQ